MHLMIAEAAAAQPLAMKNIHYIFCHELFFSQRICFCLTSHQVKKLPVVQQMEHSTFQVLVQFSEHFETQQELPGNPLRVLHQ
jgi:hypothetical protein